MSERSAHHDSIVIERSFDAPPARVFAAWADPAAKACWDLPDGDWVIAEDRDDFRVGGRAFRRFGPPGEPTYGVDMRYLDIVPDRRIIMAGTMAHGETRVAASMITVELLPSHSGTRLIYTEQGAFLAGRDAVADHEHGWASMLDKLHAFLRERP